MEKIPVRELHSPSVEKFGLNTKMKIHIILLSCLYSTLAITVNYETTGNSDKNAKDYRTALKDIRLVTVNQDAVHKPIQNQDVLKTREEPNLSRQNSQIKRRGEKKKSALTTARVGRPQTVQTDPNHQNYMQKMANQLYLAQKHASLLSDYQKFIVKQDQNVKNFVLGQSAQERNAKSLLRQRSSGSALSAGVNVKPTEPVAAGNTEFKKTVVVTPKVQTTARIISKPQNDHLAQPTHIKYVTIAPQSLTNFVGSHEPSQKVTLVPYHSPQEYTYYDLGVTVKPQVETVQIPTTVSLGLGSYDSSKYYTSEGGHSDDSPHHEDTNYEFMYNVKDHEKHNHFGHKESRMDKTTYGYYFVQLPDGRLETVKYWADKTGYHAKVDYHGEAKHPTIHSDHKLHNHNLIHH